MIDACKIKPGVYIGRTLLPSASHRGVVVRVANATDKAVKLSSNTFLGQVVPVEVVSDTQAGHRAPTPSAVEECPPRVERADTIRLATRPKFVGNARRSFRLRSITTQQRTATNNVQAKLVEGLPHDLSRADRKQVEQLLKEYDGLFSRGPHDMGRTTLVEHLSLIHISEPTRPY